MDFYETLKNLLNVKQLIWDEIDWIIIKTYIRNKQVYIYERTKLGDFDSYRSTPMEIIGHPAAKILAVLKVTQENTGRNTPGVDKQSSKNIKDRLEFAKNLCIDGQSSKIKRIWIPKPGKKKKRPLGIPTITDRAKQMLVKIALEPEWEYRFQEHSYGFRPGRSTRDAIAQVINHLKASQKYILDADISKCFDRINHKKLLEKVNTTPLITEQLNVWLKAGIVDSLNVEDKEEVNPSGTPQGGIVSPLLCNIALHGMYEVCLSSLKTYFGRQKLGVNRASQLGFIRFADDFVIFHPDLKALELIKQNLAEFLKDIDLEFSESKTRICHSLNGMNNQEPGITFLGYRVIQFHTKKQDARSRKKKKLGFKCRILPSPKNVKGHMDKIKRVINTSLAVEQTKLIKRLNPIIKGWSNYYKHVHSTKTFSYCDFFTIKYLFHWAERRHGQNNRKWISNKYFEKIEGNKWRFRTLYLGVPWHILSRHVQDIQRYNKVPGNYSPFSQESWDSQQFKALSDLKNKLYKRQKGNCGICGKKILDINDPAEVHHLLPPDVKDINSLEWLRLVHQVCHDRSHNRNMFEVEEEPDEE